MARPGWASTPSTSMNQSRSDVCLGLIPPDPSVGGMVTNAQSAEGHKGRFEKISVSLDSANITLTWSGKSGSRIPLQTPIQLKSELRVTIPITWTLPLTRVFKALNVRSW
jgi:hypothetical protein